MTKDFTTTETSAMIADPAINIAVRIAGLVFDGSPEYVGLYNDTDRPFTILDTRVIRVDFRHAMLYYTVEVQRRADGAKFKVCVSYDYEESYSDDPEPNDTTIIDIEKI